MIACVNLNGLHLHYCCEVSVVKIYIKIKHFYLLGFCIKMCNLYIYNIFKEVNTYSSGSYVNHITHYVNIASVLHQGFNFQLKVNVLVGSSSFVCF